MTRNSLAPLNCSLARSLDLVGEWWTLLIIREAAFGTRRFQDFAERLGVARNILSARLKRLVAEGLMARLTREGSREVEYRLTPKGDALFPVLVTLMQWGDEHCVDHAPPILLVDRVAGQPLPKVEVRAADGRVLALQDLRALPGPGADEELHQRLGRPRVAALMKAV